MVGHDNIVVWNKLADFSTEYLEKGQMVYIEGPIRSRSWVDTKEQKRKTSTELIFIEHWTFSL